jgi:16S rRNA (guanine(527)-N(7))-methyltransferase RsmG
MGSTEGLEQLLIESGIALETERAHLMLSYFALLKKWNSRINLTATTEWPGIEPLFREGMWAAGMYTSGDSYHLDIGSGAGFPAIILRILSPHIRLEMVESRIRRSAFLETVIEALGMKGVRVHARRLHELLLQSDDRKIWDCISWKGLKLSSDDLLKLRARSHPRTQFWMFHARELAVEEPEVIHTGFQIFRREKCPGRKDWALSIYLPR